MKMRSYLENQFASLWKCYYPKLKLEIEQRIIPKRKFRFDFVHLPSKVAIEINGGIWKKGAHSSGKGLKRDYQKVNLAQVNGYVVFQLSSEMIDKMWLDIIAETIRDRASS